MITAVAAAIRAISRMAGSHGLIPEGVITVLGSVLVLGSTGGLMYVG